MAYDENHHDKTIRFTYYLNYLKHRQMSFGYPEKFIEPIKYGTYIITKCNYSYRYMHKMRSNNMVGKTLLMNYSRRKEKILLA